MAELTVHPGDDAPKAANAPADVVVIQRTTLNYAIFAVVLFLAAYVAGWAMGSASGDGHSAIRAAVREAVASAVGQVPSSSGAAETPRQAPPERYSVAIAGNPTRGPADAPVTIIEFSDFQCPFCKRFHDETLPALLKKYEGKIRFVYRDFPIREIHANAQGAAEAAQCANDQQKYWEYHDLLFQNQDHLQRADFLAYARQLNLDVKTFQDCYDRAKYAVEVQEDVKAGQALGIGGTPTFFINGRPLVGAQPLSAFSAIIDAELAAAGKPVSPAS
jgi:protein-disulfide isomerase